MTLILALDENEWDRQAGYLNWNISDYWISDSSLVVVVYHVTIIAIVNLMHAVLPYLSKKIAKPRSI